MIFMTARKGWHSYRKPREYGARWVDVTSEWGILSMCDKWSS
jgi:hypothetical protein